MVDSIPLPVFCEHLGFRHHCDFVAGVWHVARYEMMVTPGADHLMHES